MCRAVFGKTANCVINDLTRSGQLYVNECVMWRKKVTDCLHEGNNLYLKESCTYKVQVMFKMYDVHFCRH